MSENGNGTTDDDLHVLIEFINKTLREGKDNGVHINTVATLWIILFALIITRKLFKYVIKPCRAYQQHQQTINNDNAHDNNNGGVTVGDRRSSDFECIVV